jgi:hypothetical protein
MFAEGCVTAAGVEVGDLRRSMTKAEWREVYWRLRVSRRRLRAATLIPGTQTVYIPGVDEVIGAPK